MHMLEKDSDGSHNGIIRLLLQLLSYSYENEYRLNVTGCVVMVGPAPRRYGDPLDGIATMHRKWKSRLMENESCI